MLYPNRYQHEPSKRKPYCEACDMIAIYGIERRDWNYRKFGINRIEMKEIWATALKDMTGKSRIDLVY